MKLIKRTEQNRRDFWFTGKCESCGHEEKDISGYDDHFFLNEVIPDMKCKACGKSSKDLDLPANNGRTEVHPNAVI